MRWRLIRSSLLVVKALTVSRVCLDPTTRPRPAVVAFLLIAAVADTVVDMGGSAPADSDSVAFGPSSEGRLSILGLSIRGVWVTVGLAFFHLGVLGLSAWAERQGVGLSGWLGMWKTVCCSSSDNAAYGKGLGF